MKTEYFNPPQPIRPADMVVRDRVRQINCRNSPFTWCIVKHIDKEKKQVMLYRPYATCTDFSTSSGVICYVGIEEYGLWLDDMSLSWEIAERPGEPE